MDETSVAKSSKSPFGGVAGQILAHGQSESWRNSGRRATCLPLTTVASTSTTVAGARFIP